MTVDHASTVVAHRPLPAPLEAAAVRQRSQPFLTHIEVGSTGHFPRAADAGTSCQVDASGSGSMVRQCAMHRREKKAGDRGVATPISWRTPDNGNARR